MVWNKLNYWWDLDKTIYILGSCNMQVCFWFSHNTPQMVHKTNLRPRPVSILLNFLGLRYKVAINVYLEHHEFYHIFLIFLGKPESCCVLSLLGSLCLEGKTDFSCLPINSFRFIGFSWFLTKGIDIYKLKNRWSHIGHK